MAKLRNPKGTGSFRKKADGRYEWRQTRNGKTRYITAPTPKALKEKADKVADKPISSSTYTVEQWFQKWLDNTVEPFVKPSTYEQYEYIYRVHISPVIGHLRLTQVETEDVKSVIAKMSKKGLATKTMKHARSVMHLGFKAAKKIIGTNPVDYEEVHIPKKQAKKRKTLTPREIQALLIAMKDSRWIHSVRFCLATGVRRGELLALKWSDIDVNEKTINIHASNGKNGLGDLKSAEERNLPLSKSVLECLKNQKDMLFSEGLRNCKLVFPNNKGEMLKANSYFTVIARFAKKAEIYAHPHCLRHTFVYLVRDKLSLKDLQYILGHADSTQTLDIYGDIINENNKSKITAIDSVFNKLEKELEKIEKKKNAKVVNF